MRNKCECGTIFEFPENKIGTTIVCQNCEKEIVLVNTSLFAGDFNQKASKLGKFFFFYILFFGLLLIFLVVKDGDPQKEYILRKTLYSFSTSGDNLKKQAKKALNRARLLQPRCIGKWNASEREDGHWIVSYQILNSGGYCIKEALFEVIPADQLMVLPINEMAVALQGDIESQKQFLEGIKKQINTVPKVDTTGLLRRAPSVDEIEEKMSQLPKLLKNRKK